MGSDVKIARALISVTDKTGVVDFARTLVDDFGVEIISTGGTARAIEDAGVPVTPIEEFTGYPEMMDGRVKTLHPKVHGALLARRDSEQHMQEAAQHGIKLIDLVVVNLYEFEKTVANPVLPRYWHLIMVPLCSMNSPCPVPCPSPPLANFFCTCARCGVHRCARCATLNQYFQCRCASAADRRITDSQSTAAYQTGGLHGI